MADAVDEDFVFVDGDDAISVSSSRSSLFLVDDPSNDALMLHGESPQRIKSGVDQYPPKADEESASKECLQSPCTVSGAEDQENPIKQAETTFVQPKPVADCTVPLEDPSPPQEQPKFLCSSCSLEVGMQSDIIWEGYMGANKAAYLLSKVVNLEAVGEPRKQQLSTGQFLLQDMRCKSCSTAFGWTYLKAWNQDQKYKEGTTIVPRGILQLVGDTSSESTTTAVHCQ